MRRVRPREVGRVIRTVQLLRYLSDAPLRGRVTAATSKVEAFNGCRLRARSSTRSTWLRSPRT
ncbi:Tn3 family transposase [Streptomyces sp. NPDC090021]|uniref:Tn3 family transposase n=1 Tax=Streptomyces sp. NPDC090021 TaxID=3365919 RepID=UPI0037F65683